MINKVLRFLILNIKDKEIVKKFKQLKVSQSLSKDEIVKNQLHSLNELLNHAYNNVPYYRSLIKDSGLLVNNRIELSNIDSFKALPFLSKDIIREQQDKLYDINIEARKAYRNTSGGSTGEPVVFMQDANYNINNLANSYLAKSWRGASIYDDTVVLWGAERDTFEGKKPYKQVVKDFFLNTLRLNTFVLTEELMQKYINILNKRKPKLIVAYVQSIYAMAQYAKEHDIKVQKQNAIHAAAGTVFPFMREEIEAVFGCKVFNHYGTREVGAIASECSEHKGLHIMMEHNIVEVINDQGVSCKPGETGHIVITTLNNYSMPLIRYRIGDLGVLSENQECSCGCHYFKLEKVEGRSTDRFKTLTGAVVMPEYFIHLIGVVCNKGNIRLFQVIQDALDKLTIKIVKEGDILQQDLDQIKEKIKIVMGNECVIYFDFVEDIPKTKTGKYLYTISNVEA